MFDNLRNEAGFIEEEEPAEEVVQPKPSAVRRVYKRPRTFDQLTGTTPFQRFVLASMLLVMVCLIGVTLLLLTEKVVPSFLY
jgi:hypothetical protein